MSTETLAVIGAISGLVALALSVFNAWLAWSRDRVRLSIDCSQETLGSAFGADTATAEFSIQIENRGMFDVSIEDAGIDFEVGGAPRIVFDQTVTSGEDTETLSLPLWVKSHQALTLNGGGTNLAVQQHRPRRAYVKTGSGVVITGKIRGYLISGVGPA